MFFIGSIVIEEDDLYVYKSRDKGIIRLIIPNIEFDKNIYYLNDTLNYVDRNIELLEESNIDNNIFYIVGHSGNGDNCYFNRINELIEGDYLYVYINSEILIYEVVGSYEIVKNGYMEIVDDEVNVLYLITCKVYNYNRQFVVKSKLI